MPADTQHNHTQGTDTGVHQHLRYEVHTMVNHPALLHLNATQGASSLLSTVLRGDDLSPFHQMQQYPASWLCQCVCWPCPVAGWTLVRHSSQLAEKRHHLLLLGSAQVQRQRAQMVCASLPGKVRHTYSPLLLDCRIHCTGHHPAVQDHNCQQRLLFACLLKGL